MTTDPQKRKCVYVNDVCKYCGHVKGWRIHKMHRHSTWQPCPGRKWR